MKRLWYPSVVVLICASACFGWGVIGHKTAANIADHFLSPEAKAEVARLLGDKTMADVALWGDHAATQPAYRWTQPHGAYVADGAKSFDMQRDCADGKCVVARVVLFKETLQNPQVDKVTKADALRFLIHFIPDMHSPVHVVRKKDKAVQVEFFGEQVSLHLAWDNLLIGRLKTTPIEYADVLLRKITAAKVGEWTKDMGPAHWATESYRHALNVAYALPPSGRLGQDYVDRCMPIVHERLSMAGVRLAAVLNEVFGGRMPTSAAYATQANAKCKGAHTKRPAILGHRGALAHAPENTLAAFSLCLLAGTDIELDVHPTKDGHLVVIHDTTVDRTTDGKGRVSDLTLDQIKRMDAGSWFHPDFTGELVPTLDEVFDFIVKRERRPTTIAIDIKKVNEHVFNGVIESLRKNDVFDRTFVFNMSLDDARAFKKREPRIRCAALVKDRNHLETTLDLDFIDVIWINPWCLDVIDQIHAADKQVYCALINSEALWLKAKADGVDGIGTNYPLRMKRAAWPVSAERDWDHYLKPQDRLQYRYQSLPTD